jgi:hypothetical protein
MSAAERAATASGWPYPLPTDPVAQGAQAIKDLADLLEIRVSARHVCKLNRSTIYIAGTGGIATAPNTLLFDTVLQDVPGGMWNPAFNARITAQDAGVYAAYAHCLWAGSATGFREIAIRKNGLGGSQLAYTQVLPSIGVGNGPDIDCFGFVTLAAGDYLECLVGHTAGGNLNVDMSASARSFTVWRIA